MQLCLLEQFRIAERNGELPRNGYDAVVYDVIKWRTEKPLAKVTLDDRAMTFTGTFPSMQEVHDIQAWNGVEPLKPTAVSIGDA